MRQPLAADHPRRTDARAEFVDGIDRCAKHFGMFCQTQIIVMRQADLAIGFCLPHPLQLVDRNGKRVPFDDQSLAGQSEAPFSNGLKTRPLRLGV